MHRVNIVGRHLDITAGMKEKASQKLERIQRYFDGVQSVELILSEEGTNSRAEIIVSVVRGEPVIVKESHDTLFGAIDVAVDRVEQQLRKLKDKRRDHKGARASAPDVGSVGVADENEMNDDD